MIRAIRRPSAVRPLWRIQTAAGPLVLGIVLTIPFYLLMAGLVVYPIVNLAVTAGAPHGIAANFRAFLNLPLNLVALRITFVDSFIVTAIVVTLGSVVAWSLRTTSNQWTRLTLLGATAAPLLMNSILKVFTFTVLLDQHGLVNEALIGLHIIHSPLPLLYNQFAVILGMVYYMFPYATLPLYVAFLSIDLDLIRTAEICGASRPRALLDAALPLALPGIFATIVIDYVYCLGFFVIPLLLGSVNAPFTSNLIWQDVTDFFDLTGAAVSSLVLLAAAAIAVGVGYIVVGRDRLLRAAA